MLLFVFGLLVYWTIEQKSLTSGITLFTAGLQSGLVNVVKKTKKMFAAKQSSLGLQSSFSKACMYLEEVRANIP